ncbi:hypothetical protein D3C71_2132890 [compost metagenome]
MDAEPQHLGVGARFVPSLVLSEKCKPIREFRFVVTVAGQKVDMEVCRGIRCRIVSTLVRQLV